MAAKTIRKVGKFKFLRFPNRGIRRNEQITKLATRGKLSYSTLEKFINKERGLGYPIKYSKPIGFRRKKEIDVHLIETEVGNQAEGTHFNQLNRREKCYEYI